MIETAKKKKNLFLEDIQEKLYMQTGTKVNFITASTGKTHSFMHTQHKSVSRREFPLFLYTLSVIGWHRVYEGNCVTTVTHYK